MRNRQSALSIAALSLLPALILFGCDVGCGDEAAPVAVADGAGPDLRLVLLTDLKGYLGPCGCTSRPLGGIDRTAARLSDLRSDGVPTLLLSAGDTLFGEPLEGPEGAATQELWQAEALGEILGGLELVATTPGPRDFERGLDPLLEAAEGSPFSWLATGVRGADGTSVLRSETSESRALELANSKLIEVDGRIVGLLGLLQLPPEGTTLDEEALALAEAEVTRLRGAGAEVVIGLVHGRRTFIREVASRIGPDFLVQGGLDQDEVLPPRSVAGTWVFHAGRQGQGLLVVDVHLSEGESWADASPWTRELEAERTEREIATLRERIEEWEAAEGVNPADIATQRERLAGMVAELGSLRGAVSVAEGRRFVARWEEISVDIAPDPEVRRMVGEYDRRVNEHNREAFADVRPPEPGAGEAHYVGSAACAPCHEEANRWWSLHPHGRAYATLEVRHKEYDLGCVGCHVTGYGRPGGSTVTHNLDGALVNVGCEVCHGAGSVHVESPEAELPNFRAETDERVCLGCHNQEHSDLFDYETYRGRLLVPGHGLPSP